MSGKRMKPEDLRRVLSNATGKCATWQEVDLVKDHIAALEAELTAERDAHEREKSERERNWSDLKEARAELARLKPTGQVAEDESLLRKAFDAWAPGDVRGVLHASLSHLAAKAQGYEAIRKALADNYGTDGDPLERVKDLLESEERACSEARIEQDERHRVENERDAALAELEAGKKLMAEHMRQRDAAVADNAALLEAFENMKWAVEVNDPGLVPLLCLSIMKRTHIGDALLEQHRKEMGEMRDALLSVRTFTALDGLPCWCRGVDRDDGRPHSPGCLRIRGVLGLFATERSGSEG